ncbi:MAG: hypothetical protein ABJH07_00650 [Sedimentitalea sp.]|uniref:hypothetical protein n=1 Tax=Sedimentitalea sp. TaxID=2048915 RepID=UPI003264F3FB
MNPHFDDLLDQMRRDARNCNLDLKAVMKDTRMSPPIKRGDLFERRTKQPCDACGRPMRPEDGAQHGSNTVCSPQCAEDALRWRRWAKGSR